MYDELKERCRACSQGCIYPAECSYFGKPPLRCMRQLLSEAADAIEELSKPRWIPVTERLPEMNVPCLVYNSSQPTMVGWRIDEKRFRIPGSYLPDHPTHWMSLPEPPKEET